jgi:hypothetical protein
MIGTQYKWLAGTNYRKLFTHVKKELKTKCSTFPTKEKKIDGFMGLSYQLNLCHLSTNNNEKLNPMPIFGLAFLHMTYPGDSAGII